MSPYTTGAIVLLSGGLDSSAALLWACATYKRVDAIGFDYGQPHRDNELTHAGWLARKHGVRFSTIAVADAMNTRAGLLRPVGPSALDGGVDTAFMPGRNLAFLVLAAAHAATWSPEPLALVVGANDDDAAGFPDCRAEFFQQAAVAIGLGIGRPVCIDAPFLRLSKAGIVAGVALAGEDALADVLRSWSCYAGGAAPCGACTACVGRARAVSDHGLVDLTRAARMHGGDPARSAKR